MSRLAGLVSILAAIVMLIGGATVWVTVSNQLAEERISVPADSEFMGGAFAGKDVKGPLTAYAQAETIRQHATAGAEGTVYEGKTYAELGTMVREAQDAGDEALAEELQTRRNLVMDASFLRASLFTSVVSFGVSALVMGLGVVLGFIGAALLKIAPKKAAVPA
ncbi:aromatic ring-opening dioxygenase LigA [Rothia nasimurium]|uniref:aromatic ring-opening dioxygenase LigA n=1 Tax=Rothia nasimurium TaxID=85336 RepID=UPI001F31CF81|nr:aromatic ring-opening dioxygenase LigA [Rothia nasimurium]